MKQVGKEGLYVVAPEGDLEKVQVGFIHVAGVERTVEKKRSASTVEIITTD